MYKNSKKGFTLIEMLIVIAVIGVLSSIVVIGLGPVQRRGRDARRISDLKQIQTALELYYTRCTYYPGDAPTGNDPCAANPTSGAKTWVALEGIIQGTNLGVPNLPFDPSVSRARDGADQYGYMSSPDNRSYVVRANLEDTANPALTSDIDTVFGDASFCADPWYCVGSVDVAAAAPAP